jgi:hypothetical protein
VKLCEIKVEHPKKVQLLQAITKEIGMRVRLPKDLSPEELEKAVDQAVRQINADASYYRHSTPYTIAGRGRIRLNDYGKFTNHVYSLLKNALAVTAWEGHEARFNVDMGLKGLGVKRPIDDRAR